jgi:hypothetical protein
MTVDAFRERFCVIGAGPCGLTAAKNFLAAGLPIDVLERNDDIGGNWRYGQPGSSVYASAHLISSKTQTEYVDFPMSADYPAYPSQRQVWEYLRSYARHFQLYDHIQFGQSVAQVRPGDSGWLVQVAGESSPRQYRGVIVANGHHSDPLHPQLAGSFDGEILHAHDYKTPDLFRGRRVLVLGAGNSGCDIAVEAAEHAQAAFISMRRGYHFLPKFLRGKPIDVCGETLHRWGFPLALRRAVASVMIRIAVGPLENYGLPKPDHRLFETHPIVNSQLLYHLGHGHIGVKPNIAELQGTHVKFADGSVEPIDLIVCATGYKISFPFLDPSLVLDSQGRPRLYLNAFHPQYDDFFVAGLIQPDSGIWGLADLQCRLMAHYVRGWQRDPASVAWFKKLKAQGHVDLGQGVRYVDTPRHALEVEYYGYRQRLKKLLARFGDRL